MSVASELTALQADITAARQAVTTKGGTVTSGGGSSQLATDISTIPSGGVPDVATAAEMDANLILANNGKMYHYTGTTTSKYVQGRYYIVKNYDTRIDLSKIGTNYIFEDSDVLTLDQNKYFGPYRSTNYHVRLSYSVAKIYTKSPNLVVWINSYAEYGCDYTIASAVDLPNYPTSSSGQKASTYNFQNNPRGGLNTTYWKRLEYTAADGLTNDGTEHYIWIVFRKDGTYDSGDDRGYFVVEKPLYYQEYLSPIGNLTITDTVEKDVTSYKTAQVDSTNLYPSNIKKDVTILGVTGTLEGGGGGGYNLSFSYVKSDDNSCSLTLNGNIVTYPLCTGGYSSSAKFYANMPSVSKLKVGGDGSYRSACVVELTMGGTTRSLSFGEEVTLTADASLYIFEGSCLAPDTIITMADGEEKRIDAIKVGDKILSYNPESMQVEEDEVTYCDAQEKKSHTEYDIWEFEGGYVVRTVHRHRFYNVERQAMVYMDEWNIGEHTITITGEQVALLKHTNIQRDIRHYTLFTRNQNYFANGMLSGNRNTPELHIGSTEQMAVESLPSKVYDN